MMYKREERWSFEYAVPTASGAEDIKVIYPRSKEKVDENRRKCQELGYRVVSVKKLYPFSTIKHQHDFDHINNICFNRMHDIEQGSPEEYEGEYDSLYESRTKAQEYFCWPLPVAWVPYEDLQKAKELVAWSVNHRIDTCIKNGRLDLIQYCD